MQSGEVHSSCYSGKFYSSCRVYMMTWMILSTNAAVLVITTDVNQNTLDTPDSMIKDRTYQHNINIIAHSDSEKCIFHLFPCKYTYVLILPMVSMQGFKKTFPFFNLIQGQGFSIV